MAEFYPVVIALVFMLIMGATTVLLLRLLNPAWWSHLWIRRTSYIIPLYGCMAIMAWGVGVKYGLSWLIFIGAAGAALTVILQFALILSLPISGAIHGVSWLAAKLKTAKKQAREVKPDPVRRRLLKSTAAVFPLLAVTAGADGFIESFSTVNVPHLKFAFADLPEPLRGLRILQISDVHLGHYVDLSNLEQMVAETQGSQPDLVLITGDLADDLDSLAEALRIIVGIKPKLGTYACLGNHEYYRGVERVKAIHKDGPVPLLINNGITLDVNGSPLFVAGADDPRWMRHDTLPFLEEALSQTLTEAPSQAFKIVMSHRPEAFDCRARQGVHLMLSGHTHGGQIGFAGRSVIESAFGRQYMWGHYTKPDGGHLYTTAGMGHWFPFRLGCPPEAPLIELT